MTLRPQKIWLALVGERVQVRLGAEVVDADIVDAVTPDDALLWLAQEGVRARRIVERGSGYSMWATCKWESESAATNGST